MVLEKMGNEKKKRKKETITTLFSLKTQEYFGNLIKILPKRDVFSQKKVCFVPFKQYKDHSATKK